MRTGQEICARLSEADLPPSDAWNPKVGFSSEVPQVRLTCDQGWHIASIRFASFGTPEGDCGAYVQGSCHVNVTSIWQSFRALIILYFELVSSGRISINLLCLLRLYLTCFNVDTTGLRGQTAMLSSGLCS